jgi:hypothetical protein
MKSLFNKRIRGIHLYFKYNTKVYRIYFRDGFTIELLDNRDRLLLDKLRAKHIDKDYFLV